MSDTTPTPTSAVTQLVQGKQKLEKQIAALLIEFEEDYALNSLSNIRITRWNGSNNAWGKIVEVQIQLTL